MGLKFEPLGNFIRPIDERNTDLITKSVIGINIDKYFMPSVANIIGTDLSNYKLLRKGRFACNPMHVGRDGRLPVARYTENIPAIVSPAYFMFEVVNNNEIEPEYLMICFRHPDFDRMCWFRTDTSVRGGISWEDICALTIPVPPLSEQRKIIHDHQVITNRIELLQKINRNLDNIIEILFTKLLSDAENCNSNEKVRIGDHILVTRGVSYSPNETTDIPTKGYLPIFRANNIMDGMLVYDDLTYVSKNNIKDEQLIRNRSIIIAMSSGSKKHVGKVAMAYEDLNYSYGAFCAMITIEKKYEGLISTFLKGSRFKTHLEQVLLGTTINNIKREDIEDNIVIIPSLKQLSFFEEYYQKSASYKANFIKEINMLRTAQKMLILNLIKGA